MKTHALPDDAWLKVLQQKIESLRFGVVQIVVHEGKVVQLERTEKIRFDQPRPAQSAPSAALS